MCVLLITWMLRLVGRWARKGKVNWLFNVTINDISVIHVTAHRCAGGLKKKLDLRSRSQRNRHFVGFFNVPVLAPTRDHPFYTVIPTHRPIQSPFTITLGIRRCTFSTCPHGGGGPVNWLTTPVGWLKLLQLTVLSRSAIAV